MEEGDIIIDGGNALYTDTIRREKAIRERGLHFVGAGISGGEEGALNGPSIMPGGPAESYKSLGPLLEEISAHVDGVPCCTHIGPDGAGHFVKMVHNGIEYSDMQLIGEAYQLLRDGLGMHAPRRSPTSSPSGTTATWTASWSRSPPRCSSQIDAKTGKPLVDVILDEAEQKGTGRWTVKSALDLGVPDHRYRRGGVRPRAVRLGRPAQGAAPGWPPVSSATKPSDATTVHRGRPQGAVRLEDRRLRPGLQPDPGRARDEYDWDITPGDMATIWRGGCIIRAKFLNRIKEAFDQDPELPTLIAAPYFRVAIEDSVDSWRRVVVTATELGIPIPGFSSALSYYDALRTERLPAALTQGLRDLFGAHTYGRIDADPDQAVPHAVERRPHRSRGLIRAGGDDRSST